ncbi:MAG: hypothetical protein IPJ61_17355 [Tessaracoccus sp.]|uniref:hypothetical protein n=1 Tax=Tessaracoccus sp. TaxID=1971211 RepID=UPI001EC11AE3|nr:hypothetical protein [Tessaracoccus sp.]MBK7822778.1 hypothetical protein [Tessaracoccus sp.]
MPSSADFVTGNTLAVATLTSPIADSQSHVPQLSAMITALQDSSFVEAAREAADPETLAQILAARFGE